MAEYFILPHRVHDEIAAAAFRRRGFTAEESAAAARFCNTAARHGIRTHNLIKALHLDEHFGSGAGGCQPAATIEILPSPYPAVQRWNAHRKMGMAVAYAAMARCMELADRYGLGAVAVDNAFHYLWGGGYVLDAADRGYIAYTCCTAALAEVVPFQGRYPTLGTNPHSWGLPTRAAIGFNLCIDWATSVVAMGRVQQFLREGRTLPPRCAVDAQGRETTDPSQVAALLPFGEHKGYGLSLLDELLAAFIGGSLPTLRSRWHTGPPDEKHTPCFFFQCLRPDAVAGGAFAQGRNQMQNVQAVLQDILGHGNEHCLLPGQLEAQAAALSERHGGLLFTSAEIDALAAIAAQVGVGLERGTLKTVEVA